MGRSRTIARRSFLVGSVAIAGGVAFGTYQVKKTPQNPLTDALGDDAVTFNAWVKVDANGVTLITPHVDLGQGAHSMQAALIAEELDIEFGQFTVDHGVPSPAYYNTALADEAVPFLSNDVSAAAETMREVMGGIVKLVGAQVTGGSTSVPDSFDKLRMAGAVARETLKAAAAQQTGVPISALKTAKGAVELPDGSTLTYAELAIGAAAINPVLDVTLRDPSQWRMIGKDMMRLDILAKSTGTQTYGIDLFIQGMVNASARVNPRKGGEMLRYDATAAETMRGVQKIVPLRNGVAVVANNTWYAIQAVNAVAIDWGPAPYLAEQEAHWKALEDGFTDDTLDREWRHDGDVPAALADSSVIAAEYRAPYVAHQPLEPLSAVVRVTDTRADIWVGHQLPRFVQKRVAAMTGLPADAVFLHNQYMGGSFGHRLEFENIDRTVEVALQMKGTPVKLTFSREEDFAQDFPRQISVARGAGTVKDGRVESYDLGIAATSAVRSQSTRLNLSTPGPDSQLAAGAWNLPYDVPHFRVRSYAVTGLGPTSSWRSVGASTNGFFADCLLDELCIAAGADPLEERLRLVNDLVARKVLEVVAEMSDWGSKMETNRGRGIAFASSFGVPTAEVIEVTNTDSGIQIDKVFVALDVGRVVDPVSFENIVQGGVIWALGHAINSEITYEDGQAQQSNYYDAEGMRLYQAPDITVCGLENASKIRGVGEPPVPPAAPALANAIFAATGQRIREMPFNKHIDFV